MRWIAGLILVAFALTAFAAVSSKPPSPQQPASNNDQAAKVDNRGTEESPLFIKTVEPPEAQAVAAKKEQAEQEKASFDRWAAEKTVELNFGLVAVGAVQAFIILYTALITNKAANAAKDAAEAVPIAERAYIYVGTDRINITLGPTMTPVGHSQNFSCTNMGKTPGIVVETATAFSANEPLGKVAVYPRATIKHYDTVVGPTATTVHFHVVSLGGPTQPFYYGYVRYRDVFNKIHTSRFCMKIDYAALKQEPAGSAAYHSEE